MKILFLLLTFTTFSSASIFTFNKNHPSSIKGIDSAAQVADCIIKDNEYQSAVLAGSYEQTRDSSAQIVANLNSGKVAVIRDYKTFLPTSSVNAHTVNNEIYMNKWKNGRPEIDLAGTLVHEYYHVLGYSHKGNKAKYLQGTVPYKAASFYDQFYNKCKQKSANNNQ